MCPDSRRPVRPKRSRNVAQSPSCTFQDRYPSAPRDAWSRERTIRYQEVPTGLLLVPKLLMDSPDLLLHVDVLHHLQPGAVALLQRRPVVPGGRLFAPRQLLLRDRLARDAVEEVAALARQPLKVVCHILRREVRRRVTAVRLGFLLLPARVQELDCAWLIMLSTRLVT
jgi:hypothetical protein